VTPKSELVYTCKSDYLKELGTMLSFR